MKTSSSNFYLMLNFEHWAFCYYSKVSDWLWCSFKDIYKLIMNNCWTLTADLWWTSYAAFSLVVAVVLGMQACGSWTQNVRQRLRLPVGPRQLGGAIRLRTPGIHAGHVGQILLSLSLVGPRESLRIETVQPQGGNTSCRGGEDCLFQLQLGEMG